MRLTVLGNTGAYPEPGGACSGYLFESAGSRIIMGFGSGVMSNLKKHLNFSEIDLIICSHLHSDHISDLYVLRYALESKGLQMPLFVPSEPSLELASLYFKDVYKITTLSEDLILNENHLTITFKIMNHPVLDFGTKITDGETIFLYTGDTADTPALLEFAKGVDVMLCDATFLEDVVSEKHLSVKEACEIANEALYVTKIGKSFDIKALSEN